MNNKHFVWLVLLLCVAVVSTGVLPVGATDTVQQQGIREIVVGAGDYTDNAQTPGTYDGAWMGIKAVETGSIGGKSADDMASYIEVTKEQSSFRSIRYHYNVSNYESDFYLTTDIYVSEGAIGSLSFGSGNKYFDISGDGTVTCGSGSSNITLADKTSVNSWHRVVLAFAKDTTYNLTVYFDGVEAGTWHVGNLTGSRQSIAFCADYGSVKGSSVAFDNTRFCEGIYDLAANPYIKPEITADEDKISLANGKILWEESKITTVSELISAIDGGENTIRIFKDSSMKEEAAEMDMSTGALSLLSGDEYVVAESPDGVFSYYPTLKQKLEVTDVIFTGDDTSVGAKAVLSNTTSAECNVVMMIVFFNEKGVMKKIVSSDDTVVSGTDVMIEIQPVSAPGLEAQVLFIDGWSSKLRLFDNIFYKE